MYRYQAAKNQETSRSLDDLLLDQGVGSRTGHDGDQVGSIPDDMTIDNALPTSRESSYPQELHWCLCTVLLGGVWIVVVRSRVDS